MREHFHWKNIFEILAKYKKYGCAETYFPHGYDDLFASRKLHKVLLTWELGHFFAAKNHVFKKWALQSVIYDLKTRNFWKAGKSVNHYRDMVPFSILTPLILSLPLPHPLSLWKEHKFHMVLIYFFIILLLRGGTMAWFIFSISFVSELDSCLIQRVGPLRKISPDLKMIISFLVNHNCAGKIPSGSWLCSNHF